MERGRHEHDEPGEGCLTRLVRVPVRVVVLVVVVPLRMIWDVLTACGRALNRTVLSPVGRAIAWPAVRVAEGALWLGKAFFVWPWVALWRYVLAPAGRGIAVAAVFLARYLVVVPVTFLVRYLVIVPVTFLVRYLVVVPAVWLYRTVLTPLGHGLVLLVRGIGMVVTTLVRWIVVVPAVALWRYVLLPAGRALAAAVTVVVREVGDALGHCWRAAGFLSRAVGRFLGRLLRWIVVEPCRWVYRSVLTPFGHGIRDGIWRPVRHVLREAGRATSRALSAARESARQARKEIRRALFGAPREPVRAKAAQPRRELGDSAARTLGKTSGRDLSPPTRG
ncbi:hypothetical protein [Streptomyces halobius]|uniref:Integral membrane protein n=1 Tax=Streptomyces halobius TaxID=2879846 RepID=A0ABY4MGC2_9ACTN|nr:hypothetical protein [Streptomyces halobius]UQA95411.1 hypothetical protein K9S39_29335 [Streptomyces halobius]